MPKHSTDFFQIATVNVRSIATPERLAEFETSVEKIKFDIIGLSETRMSGAGRMDLHSGYSLYYSGSDGRTSRGVGFYVPSSLNRNIKCYFHSERIIELVLTKSPRTCLRIIQVHAPHSDYEDSDYEDFLDDLATIIDSRGNKHLIVLGDFNASVGSARANERYIGPNAAESRNHRGVMLAAFCEERRLYLANTFFQKRKKSRWTWQNNALGLKKEIDYVIVQNMRGLTDVGVLVSINVGSDHRLVRCTLRLRSTRRLVRPHRGTMSINDELLISTTHELVNKMVLTGDVRKDYSSITNLINDATERASFYEPLPPRISQNTRELLRQRRQLRHGTDSRNVEYAELCKLIRRSFKEDLYRRHVEILQKAIQSCRIRLGQEELTYARRSLPPIRNTPTCFHNSSASHDPVSDAIKAVQTFYNNLYRSSYGCQKPPSGQIEVRFTPEEVGNVLRSCKTRPKPGADGVRSAVMRPISNILAEPLCQFFNSMIKEKTVPEDLAFAHTVLLYKSGDPANIANYRPISLLSTLYKVLTKLITRRLEEYACRNAILPPEQAGFRRNFSTVDHIQTITTLLEKSYEFNVSIYFMFIDFKKAFDSVELPALWDAMESFGFDQGLIKLAQLLYANGRAAARIGDDWAEFQVERGVRQGDSLSPLLFNVVLQYGLNNVPWQGRGLRLNGRLLSYLAYADDVVLIANNVTELTEMATALSDSASSIGLEINFAKTKWLHNQRGSRNSEEQIVLCGETIEKVEEFIYLGQLISCPRNPVKEIRRRIHIGRAIYFKYRTFLRAPRVAIQLKRKLVNYCILPAVLYGCETWIWTKQVAACLRTAERRLERAIIRVRLGDKVNSRSIRQRTGLKDWIHSALRRKWKYAAKLSKKSPDESWTRVATDWTPEGKRSTGRPRMRWIDELAKFKGCPGKDLAGDWTKLFDGDVKKSAELFARKARCSLCRCDKRV
ncbi:hypothetical protein Y032_0714g1764 [Ancylostoma ceylanicum]|uniref:Reverse transcriptase domain-containing protein n=1 Tax=Ancylostoma ceylanicum TaxID=53326 RepID=A0A016WHK1_9BILA|nr:hypothetical protein Y032_0714g1764 [Ancylostoma ceylanicum]